MAFTRSNRRNCLSPSSTFSRRLNVESLERKILLAGDVTANLIGGDLFITGDAADNSVQIVRDISQASPGVGDVVVQGFFSNPTTINGGGPVSFQVTGDVFIDFSAGGENSAIFGDNPAFQPDPVELPGDVSVVGGAGTDDVSFNNANIGDDVLLEDSAGGTFSFLGTSNGTVIGGNFTLDSAAGGSEIGVDEATIGGDVVMIGNSASQQSFLGITSSTVGDDVRHISVAETSVTQIENTTIGDDLRIKTGDGVDEVLLEGVQVDDDLSFNGGDGDDVFEMGAGDEDNIVGDDLYISGKGGADEIAIEDTAIGDKLRVSGNSGDDFVGATAVTVGRTALISLGSGVNEADVTNLTGARGLTILGRGENTVTLNTITTSHYVDVLTSNGDDVVDLFDVNTHSVWIATYAGVDEVSITDSEVDYLFVLLGSGDDILTLDNVTVNRLAVLSGGSGEDTLVDVDDASDINFEIDFAFENYSV